ncbi:NAD(P)-binding protein [Colletotrichum falcatum]|nr:NAD(P)-binding protein [Colletotrichum falcatum]
MSNIADALSTSPPTKTFRKETYQAISPSRPELSTKGKHAVVSGGGSGIGASIAQSLAKSGISSLGLLGRTVTSLESTKAAIESLNPETRVYLYAADVTDAEATAAALASFSESIGGNIDILVANAGYLADFKSITDSDPSDWWRSFEINVRGNFNLLRAFRPHASPSASVVHISTAMVHIPYVPHTSAYRASKIAATRLFESFAGDNPDFFVVHLHPGLIASGMKDKFGETVAATGMVYDDISLPADFVVWTVSSEARFLNGRFLHVNWDVDELKALRGELERNPSLFTVGLHLS